MKLRMGDVELELGGPYLGEFRESNDVVDNVAALRARFEDDGYLLIRGLHDRDAVKAARAVLLEALRREGQIAPEAGPGEALMAPGAEGAFWGGQREITHTEPILSILEGNAPMGFFSRLLGGPVLTYDYKWVRCIGPGRFTGAHYDIVYMGRGTPRVFTCWTPLGDIGYDNAPLAICVGSHRFERIRETYGRMDVDRDGVGGTFSTNPKEVVDKFGGRWHTSTFRMGDALIYGMFSLHGSLNNDSDHFRLSADTRYQLASEPVDDRWIGDKPLMHYVSHADPEVSDSMKEARAKWGI